MKLNLYNFLSVYVPLVTIETRGEVENIAKYAYHGYPEDRKMGKAWEHSLHEWTGSGCGGRGQYLLNSKASFLPVKMSSFHHAKVWSPKMQ